MAGRRIILILGASSDLGVEFIRELEEQEKEKRQKTVKDRQLHDSGETSDEQGAEAVSDGKDAPDGRDASGQEEECGSMPRPFILAHYGHNDAVLENVKKTCSYVEICPIRADLSVHEEVLAMLDKIRDSAWFPTQIVSFAAQAYRYMRISEWDGEQVRRDMEIQFYSLAEVCKVCLPEMAKRGYGRVVVMLSACTIGEPPKFLSNYTSVKYALLGFMRSMAAEYGAQGLNINGISPAMIETKFLSGIGRKVREMNAENSPRHRNLTVRDVIPSVLYLLSDEAEFVNGINLNLTGRGT